MFLLLIGWEVISLGLPGSLVFISSSATISENRLYKINDHGLGFLSFLFLNFSFIYLAASDVSCGVWDLFSFGMQHLVL